MRTLHHLLAVLRFGLRGLQLEILDVILAFQIEDAQFLLACRIARAEFGFLGMDFGCVLRRLRQGQFALGSERQLDLACRLGKLALRSEQIRQQTILVRGARLRHGIGNFRQRLLARLAKRIVRTCDVRTRQQRIGDAAAGDFVGQRSTRQCQRLAAHARA